MTVEDTLARLTPDNKGPMMAQVHDPDGLDPPGPLATLMENAMTADNYKRMMTDAPSLDPRGPLASIHVPVLVIDYPEEPRYQGPER